MSRSVLQDGESQPLPLSSPPLLSSLSSGKTTHTHTHVRVSAASTLCHKQKSLRTWMVLTIIADRDVIATVSSFESHCHFFQSCNLTANHDVWLRYVHIHIRIWNLIGQSIANDNWFVPGAGVILRFRLPHDRFIIMYILYRHCVVCVCITCFSRFHSSTRPLVQSFHPRTQSQAMWTRTSLHVSVSSSHHLSRHRPNKHTNTRSDATLWLRKQKSGSPLCLVSHYFPTPYQSI